MIQGTRRFLSGAGKAVVGNGADPQAYVKGTGKFFADAAEGRSMNNLWTGKTFGPTGKKVVAGGLAGGIGIYALTNPGRQQDAEIQAMAKEDDIQSLPTTQADGVGYTAMPKFNMQDYAPSGDLVFALHKLRNGG